MKAWHNPDIKAKNYLGHLNEVAVYSVRIPSGSSYLLTSESFASLEYTRHADGRSVTVEALPTESEAMVDLKLAYWLDIKVEFYPAVKLGYGKMGRRDDRSNASIS